MSDEGIMYYEFDDHEGRLEEAASRLRTVLDEKSQEAFPMAEETRTELAALLEYLEGKS